MFHITKDNWKQKGVVFGICMFLFNSLVMFGTKQLEFSYNNLLFYFFMWMLGGLVYAYFSYRWQKKRKEFKNSNDH